MVYLPGQLNLGKDARKGHYLSFLRVSVGCVNLDLLPVKDRQLTGQQLKDKLEKYNLVGGIVCLLNCLPMASPTSRSSPTTAAHSSTPALLPASRHSPNAL